MATYNGAKYIREQLDSILSQTFQDFELVICDDCSSDDTVSILKEYAIKDKRIIVYVNEVNLGFKKNFENVIRKCNGEFVALSDQDDIWFPDHIEMLLNVIGSDNQLSCGNPLFVDEMNNELPRKYNYFKKNLVPSNNDDMARHIFLGRSTFQGASMLIRRSFFDIALPIPKELNYHDSWFAALSCFTGGLAFVDKYTMRYRRYSDSVTVDSQYQTPFRLFVASVLVNHALKDRLVMVRYIRARAKLLTFEQQKLLSDFEKFLKRRKTIIGRLLNLPYYICHFKAIYATSCKKIFS